MAPNDYYHQYYGASTNPQAQPGYSGYQAQRSTAPATSYQTATAPSGSHQTNSYTGYQSHQYTQPATNSYTANSGYSSNSWYQTNQADSNDGRAAEALSRMSNTESARSNLRSPDNSTTPYNTSSTGSVSYGSASGSNAYTTHGNMTSAASYPYTATTHAPQSSYASQPAHGQRQARPDSVSSVTSASHRQSPADDRFARQPTLSTMNNTQYQPQRVQSLANSQQRSVSPAQAITQHNTQRPSNAASTQYPNTSHRVLPAVTQPTQTPSATVAQYHYSNPQPTASSHQPATSAVQNEYEQQSTMTVDPSQVYDAWPEHQRKLEAARAARAKMEAAQAAQAEERRKAEEAEHAAEEARKVAEQKRLEEQRAEEARKAREAKGTGEARKRQKKSGNPKPKSNNQRSATGEVADQTASTAPAQDPEPGALADETEAEIRAMMMKMRELNSKNPSLLARIWDEERRVHAQAQAKSTSQPTGPPRPQNQQPAGAAPATKPKLAEPHKSVGGSTNTNKANGAPGGQFTAQPSTKGSTIWPHEKKGQLAAAAASWLNAVPENESRPITPDEIRRMLDGNPTYIELCEKLEGMGLQVERASFARSLLAAVPDVNSTANRQATGSNAAQRRSAGTATGGVAANSALKRSPEQPRKDGAAAQAKPRTLHRQQDGVVDLLTPPPTGAGAEQAQGMQSYVNGHWQSTTALQGLQSQPTYPPPEVRTVESPYFTSGPPGFDDQLAPVAQMVPPSQTQAPARPQSKPPASKEEAARKRTFDDLIDLTAESDDEPPSKRLFHGLPIPTAAQVQPQGYGPSPYAPPGYGPPTYAQGYNTVFNPDYPRFPQAPGALPQQNDFVPRPLPTIVPPRPQPALVDEKLKNLELVKPIDRKKALRRSTYDVKNIARDVLIATGKHPEMASLNAHLEVLKIAFKQVDNAADLDTFRWDLVDPGDPIIPQAIEEAESVADDADDEEEDPAYLAAQANPRGLMTRQVVGADGRVTTEVVAHGSHATDIAKGVVKKRRGRPPRHSYPGVTSRPYGFGDGDAPKSSTQSQQRTTGDGRQIPSRPAAAQGSSSTPARTTSQQAPRSEGSSNYRSMGYAAFRQQHFGPDGTPLPRKKGRPVGWRKYPNGKPQTTPAQSSNLRRVQNATGSGPTVIDSRSPSASAPMPRRKTNPQPDPEPHYEVYKCEWQGCSAELHNLDTLRKHVTKLHGKKAAHGGYECLWKGCSKQVTVQDKETGEEVVKHRRFDFPSPPAWLNHMEKTHISPIAWKLGDGPAAGLSDAHEPEASDAYLSDSRGRRVTPLVQIPALPEAEKAPAPARGPGRPRKTDEQKAREAQAEMVRKKRETGPGVDRGGARLAIEKRRAGFVDDEHFEEIVDDDDE